MHLGPIAQLVERPAHNRLVPGSNPGGPTILKMPLLIKDVVDKLEVLVPLNLQEDWDNSGYQIKLAGVPLTGILTTLDISDKCLDLAADKGLNLVLTHHPVFFHPLRRLDLESTEGELLNLVSKRKICVYSMHTNFDSSKYSMSRFILNKLEAVEIFPLVPHKRKLYKLSVFIPKGHVKTVRDALFAYANPKIGNYENCSFETKGKGSFRPLEGSDPFIGRVRETTFTDESRLEVLIEEKLLDKAVMEMKKAHPYEEAAFDLYPLHDYGGSDSCGMGAWGIPEKALSLGGLLEKIRTLFSPSFINYCGNLNKKIKKISVVSGSGFSFIGEAVRSGCDVLISSELKHAAAIKANRTGICLIEMPHFDTERHFTHIVKELLSGEFNVPVMENNFEINPFFQYKGKGGKL